MKGIYYELNEVFSKTAYNLYFLPECCPSMARIGSRHVQCHAKCFPPHQSRNSMAGDFRPKWCAAEKPYPRKQMGHIKKLGKYCAMYMYILSH